MAKIRQDEKGLYTKAIGRIWRPIKPTRFKDGESRTVQHYPKTKELGVEKLPIGHHEEYWSLDEE